MVHYDTIEKALEQTNSPRILLLGNGFSRAFAKKYFKENQEAFNYESLTKKTGNDEIQKLFESLGSYDFEEVIGKIKSVREAIHIVNHFWEVKCRNEKIKILKEKEKF